jgi:DNA-binding CsgD family transcriptional regulator
MRDPRDATWRFINFAPIMASQSALDDLFAEILQPFGVDRFDCGPLSSDSADPSPRLSERGLGDWNHHFNERRYVEIDPCVVAYPHLRGAFTWSQVRRLTPEHAQSPIWGDARAGGMAEGLVVPTAPGRRSAAIVRLITPESSFDPAFLPLLQSVSVIYAASTQSFQSAAAPPQPAPAPAPAPAPITLKERELECLHWAARGKTNPEIGAILNISRHTVNTHIESAKAKLGVATRVQAVAIAHRLRLLSIA